MLSGSVDAQLFWLSYFKPQLSCSADEFFQAIKELAEINNLQPSFVASQYRQFDSFISECKYVVSVQEHASMIQQVVDNVIAETAKKGSINSLRHHLKLYQGGW